MNLLDAYRYLAALEQHRHFGRAAAACHITQPALSNALRALESHLQVAIVRRGRQYEGLTPEGEQVLASAHRMLREQETLEQELASGLGLPRGRLLIGAVPTALPVAARFAARLVQQHPGIRPQVRSLSSQQIETGLEDLSLDLGLGFTDRVAAHARLKVWPQYVEHYYLLQREEAGRARPGARGRSSTPVGITWQQAAALPLGLLTAEMHHRVIVDRVFRDLQAQVSPALETNAVQALVIAVQEAGLVAVLPGAVVATLSGVPGLQARPLASPMVQTPVGFMTAAAARPSRALAAALSLAEDASWQQVLRQHSGALVPVIDH